MTTTTLILIIMAAFSTGTCFGFLVAAILAAGSRADKIAENSRSEQRVSTLIIDGLAKRKTDK